MQSLTLTADRQLVVAAMELPHIEPGGAILKVSACGICGTDLEKWAFRANPQHAVLGHELVGTLVSICPTYKGPLSPGQRVVVAHHVPCGKCHFCLNDAESMCQAFKQTNIHPGGFSQFVVLSAAHLQKTCFVIPGKVQDEQAIHVEPLACVLKAIRRGGQFKRGKTLVVGLGYIGLLTAQLYALRGDDLYSVDTQVERLRNSRQFGLQASAFLPDQLTAHGFDTVFLTVVNATTIAYALERVRNGGVIIVFADDPTQAAQLDASTLYHREITVIPSYSPGLKDLQDAARLVFSSSITLAPLVTHRASLDEAPGVFQGIRQQMGIKGVIFPNELPVLA
jgi:L-iditol 2-dehydrogenase